MRTLYIEGSMGIRCNMLLGALIEVIEDKDGFFELLNNSGIENAGIIAKSSENRGVRGTATYIKEKHEHRMHDTQSGTAEMNVYEVSEHSHERGHGRTMTDILEKIDKTSLSGKVKNDIKSIYSIMAEALARKSNNTDVNTVHLHSLAQNDTFMMIAAICQAFDMIDCERIVSSPLCLGIGYTESESGGGISIPRSEVAYVVTGIPTYGGKYEGEMTSLSGASIIKYFVKDFGEMPEMVIKKIGCGMGRPSFTGAQYIRIFCGEEVNISANSSITKLSCLLNKWGPDIDKMRETLMQKGARDIYTVQAGEDKILFVCLVNPDEADNLAIELLNYAEFIGRDTYPSYQLKGEEETLKTQYGEFTATRYSGYGHNRIKLHEDDVRKLTENNNVSYEEFSKKLETILNK